MNQTEYLYLCAFDEFFDNEYSVARYVSSCNYTKSVIVLFFVYPASVLVDGEPHALIWKNYPGIGRL